ncbi:phage tail tape measure protein [Schaalia sp.]|uniref:phage tail tape measure protein n=1 Tax=Schaalia sp. TaxID=2691890 RepID=UPI003D0C8F1D
MSSGNSAILAVRILGDAKGAVSAMKETETATGGLAGRIKGHIPSFAAVGTAFVGAGIAAGKALYDIGAQFDDLADTIRVGTGASGDALDGLVDSAKNIAKQIPASLDAIGPAVADVNTRLGLTGPVLETVASQYLEAGRILGEAVDINATSAALTQFKISGEAVSGGLDTLFRVSQGTGVSMNTLADSMTKQGPALQELGFGFETSAALVGVLDKAGLDADKTIGALGKSLVTLAKQGEEPEQALQRVIGEMTGMLDAGDRASAIDLASTLFGTKGATQFIGALETGALNMDALTGVAQGTGDTILGVGEETQDAAEKFEILKNRAMIALEPLASAIFDGLGQALDYVTGLTDGFDMGAFLDAHPVISDLIGAVQEFASTLSSVLGPIIEALAPLVLDAVTVIGTYFGDLFSLFSSVVTFIGQIINGDWAGAWNTMGQIASKGRELISNLVSGLGNLVSSAISGAITWARDTWDQGWASMSGAVSSKVSQIKSNVINGLAALPSHMLNIGKDIVRGIINGIGAMGGALWDAASNLAGNAVNAIKSTLGIHSPSRVGMSLGGFFGEGVALGLIGSASRVEGAARSMVAPLARDIMPTPAPAWAPAQIAGAAPSVVINVSGALDPVGVAEQIRRLLAQYDQRMGGVAI